MENLAVWAVIAAVGALIGTVALFILVLPDRRRPFLSPFLRGIADFLNMRRLMLETILKAAYVFLNLLVILCGVFALFALRDGAAIGIAMILLGPVVLRILHETIMLRDHLKGEPDAAESAAEERIPARRERMTRRQNRPRRENGQDAAAWQAGQEAGRDTAWRSGQPAPQAYPQQGTSPYGQQGTRQAYQPAWQQQFPPAYPSGGYGYPDPQDPNRPRNG